MQKSCFYSNLELLFNFQSQRYNNFLLFNATFEDVCIYGILPFQNGFTPVHVVAQEGNAEVATLLLDRKGDATAKAKNGLTPMHLAAQEDHVPVAETLVKHGSPIDMQTKVTPYKYS